MAKFQKGHKVNLGKKNRLGQRHRPETIFKMQKKHKSMSDIGRINIGKSKIGKSPTLETRLKMSNARRGEKNNMWKGGITPINAKIRNSLEYKLWRESVFERDNWTCVWCLVRGGELHADHIKPFALFPEIRFAIDNGRTLCKPCHKLTESYGNRWITKEFYGR
jgi:5-methylcytosine-specific restriction endonuclease McrA